MLSWVARLRRAPEMRLRRIQRAHCRNCCAPQAHSGARRSRAQNNPRGSTLSQRTGHPDDVPWSMNNPG